MFSRISAWFQVQLSAFRSLRKTEFAGLTPPFPLEETYNGRYDGCVIRVEVIGPNPDFRLPDHDSGFVRTEKPVLPKKDKPPQAARVRIHEPIPHQHGARSDDVSEFRASIPARKIGSGGSPKDVPSAPRYKGVPLPLTNHNDIGFVEREDHRGWWDQHSTQV